MSSGGKKNANKANASTAKPPPLPDPTTATSDQKESIPDVILETKFGKPYIFSENFLRLISFIH